MNDTSSSMTEGHTEESVVGKHVISSFAMEPGAPYGDETDVYSIKANSATMVEGSIVFSSFDEMEEFSNHLADYVQRHKK